MWVDNPISLASGREMYGFAKARGWMALPAAGEQEASFGLDVFGMNFDREEAPERRPLVRVTRGEHVPELADAAFSALHDVGRHLRGLLSGHRDGSPRVGVRFAESLLRDVRAGGVQQVFLHQLRSVEDGTQAALQQVTQARYRVTSLRGAPLEHEYTIALSALDSHPLATELGLVGELRTRLAYRTESQFELEAGRVVWDSAAPAPVS
jgi:hypothetical protein